MTDPGASRLIHQSFATLFAVDPDSARITHASANAAHILGHSPADMVEANTRDLLGSEFWHALRNAASHPDFATRPVTLSGIGPLADTLEMHAYASGAAHMVEVTPVLPSEFGSSATLDVVQATMVQLVAAGTNRDVATNLTRFAHRVTGYDHVIWWRMDGAQPTTALAQAKRRSRADATNPLAAASALWPPDGPAIQIIADAHAPPVAMHGSADTALDLRAAFSHAPHDFQKSPDDVTASLSMRITRRGHPAGLLEFRSARPKRPSRHLIAALKTLHPFLDVRLQGVTTLL